ncbi:MAG: 4Fe-4S binding protein [Planctomycetes bacterium]|nr:4Fe-4S binding protein [Planctomycetota bacterium]
MRPHVEPLGRSLQLDPSVCTAELFVRATCRACIEACPIDALQRQGGRWSVDAKCDSCGACEEACPTGAVVLRSSAASDIEKAVRCRLENAPGTETVLACERSGGQTSGQIRLSCAARVDEAVLVSAVLRGTGRLRIVLGDCRTCAGLRQVRRYFGRTMRIVRRILEAAGHHSERISVIHIPATDDGELNVERRAFFRRILGIAAPSGSHGTGRRNRLAAAVRQGGVRLRSAPAGELPLGRLEIGPNCVGCNVCEHVCAPGAIAREEPSAGKVVLRFDPALCIDCGACSDACYMRAARVSRENDLSVLSASQPVIVATLDRRSCSECGVPFHGAGRITRCPRCRPAGATSEHATARRHEGPVAK